MGRSKKYIVIILILLFFCIYGVQLEEYTGGLQSYIVGRLGLGAIQITSGGMMLLVGAMFPIILIEITEGINIYKHYTIGSVYYFVRQKNIKRWYATEAKNLLLIIFTVFFIFITLGYVIGCVLFGELPTLATICMVLCQCAMYVAYTYIFALLINCMSIILGADISYVIGIGIQLLLVMLLMIFENAEITSSNIWILRLNPVSCIAIVWHYIPGIDFGFMDRIGVEFDVLFSIAYLSVLGYLVYKFGQCLIVNRDIAMEDKEEQG